MTYSFNVFLRKLNFTSSSSFEKEFEIQRSNLLNHKSRNFSEEKTERERKFYSSKRLKFWNIFGRKNERNVPDSREGGSERPRPRLGITNEWSEIRPRGLLLTRPVRLSRRYFNLRGFGAAARVPAKCRTNLQTNDGKHFPRLSRVASDNHTSLRWSFDFTPSNLPWYPTWSMRESFCQPRQHVVIRSIEYFN